MSFHLNTAFAPLCLSVLNECFSVLKCVKQQYKLEFPNITSNIYLFYDSEFIFLSNE